MNIHFLPSQSSFRKQLKRDAKSGRTEWTCPKRAEVGDAVFLLILGDGVLARGTVDSVPKPAPKSWGFPGRYSAEISNVEPLAAPVSIASLVRRFPNWGYPTYPRSYATVQSPLAEEIVRFIALSESALVDEPLLSPMLSEGRPRTVNVIQYERNKRARQKCLARWGFRCVACGIAFGEAYGADLTDYIHVHHLEPVASRKNTYRLNPERDLRSMCPNCHAVAHRSDPPFSIAEIKNFIRDAQHSKVGLG
jgi:hypothetical protein